MKPINIIAIFIFTYFKIYCQDTIQLKQYVGKLKKVDALIENRKVSLLFDTGGGETFISSEIVNFLNKKAYSKEWGYRMSGEKINYQKCDNVTIKVGGTSITHSTLGVWNVMDILPKDLPKIDGIISLKSFKDRIITLDLKNNYLIIETPKSYLDKIKKMTLLEGRIATGPSGNELTLYLSALHKSHKYWFLFDSGNLGAAMFSPQVTCEWELQNDTTLTNKEYQTELTIGNKSHNVNIVVADIIHEGALNYDFIAESIYTIDLVKNKVWSN